MERDKQVLSAKNAELIRYSEQRAEAEKVYNTAMAQKILKMRSQGESISIIKDVAKGDNYVAQCKLNYEKALAIENACKESMKDIRSSIDMARSILTWQRMEYYNQ